jgi:hypothetical protein
MTSSTVISYPIPVYQNLPIHAEFYQPNVFVIERVQRGITTLVTTVLPTNFVVGQEIRLLIPPIFGSIELNGKTGFVLSFTSPTIMEVSIDSSQNVTVYDITAVATIQNAQVVAVGDVNTGSINTNGLTNQGTFIPGAFINISPL